MNRVIKFRAWDKSIEEMIDWNPLYLTDWFIHEWFIPLQFTGLLDKNGKEIYEGDVLVAYDQETETTTGEMRMVVDDLIDSYNAIRDLVIYGIKPEVIGNIYENSDLLK